MNLNLLKKLIEINSFTLNKKGVDAIGNIIKDELSFMNVEVYKSEVMGDLLVFKSRNFDDSKPITLLSGHSDTVFPENVDFKMKEEGNKLYGPGTDDMKAGLIVIIESLKQLENAGNLKNVIFTLIPDEEMKSKTFRKELFEIYKTVEYGLVYESSKNLELSGEIYNPVDRNVVVGRKGTGLAKIEVSGPGGHSGEIEARALRISAVDEAIEKIKLIKGLENHALGSVINIGTISGGSASNVLAPDCVFEVDFRVRTDEEGMRIMHGLETLGNTVSIPGTHTNYQLVAYKSPQATTDDTIKLFNQIKLKGDNLSLVLKQEKRGSGSDANEIASQGVTVVDGMGSQGGGWHTVNEFVMLDSIEPAVNLSVETIRHLTNY